MQNLENTTCKKIALATAMIGMGLVGTPDVKADEIKQHVLTTARTERPISRKATVQPKSTRLPSAIQVKTKNIPDLKQQPVVNAVQTKTGGQQASGTKTSASKVRIQVRIHSDSDMVIKNEFKSSSGDPKQQYGKNG